MSPNHDDRASDDHVAGPGAHLDTARDAVSQRWTGQWVSDRLHIAIETTIAPLGVYLEDLVGLAVRRNPRRAHLLVSTVLGKHLPTDPNLVYGSGLLLGGLVAQALTNKASDPARRHRSGGDLLRLALAGTPRAAAMLTEYGLRDRATLGARDGSGGVVVLGYAETATALGHVVADALNAPVLHSTRRLVAGVTPVGGFEEDHSHARSHLLLPEDPMLLAGSELLVLVDDELSTGSTVFNTIIELHSLNPRERYVVAALVDLRSDDDQAWLANAAADLGARIDVIALATGRVVLPEGIVAAGRDLVAQMEASQAPVEYPKDVEASATVVTVAVPAPGGMRDGGRHGFYPSDREVLEAYLRDVAADVIAAIGPPASSGVHVLGFEELMYAPLRLAQVLSDQRHGYQVTFSTTTRSPVLAVDDAGYAIRSRVMLPAHDNPSDGPGPRFAYNLALATSNRRFSTLIVVIDETADTPELRDAGGLLAQLASTLNASAKVVVVVIPAYRPTNPASDGHPLPPPASPTVVPAGESL